MPFSPYQYSLLLIIIITLCLPYLSTPSSQFCQSSPLAPLPFSCLPCHHSCLSCSSPSPSSCLSCLPQYTLTIDSYCIPCSKYCSSCPSLSLSGVTNTGYQEWVRDGMWIKCQNCMAGYYLEQGRGVCVQCGVGVAACTLAAILGCERGFYYDGGCQPCGRNCGVCNTNGCQQCNQGYYLTPSFACQPCPLNCQTCSSTSCLQCSPNFQGLTCSNPSSCSPKCSICDNGICYSCQIGFYLDYDQGGNACRPLALLCARGDSNGCTQCLSGVAYRDGDGDCVVYYWVKGGDVRVYGQAVNGEGYFFVDNKTPKVQYCLPKGSINPIFFNPPSSFQLKIIIPISNPIYSFKLFLQILITQSSYLLSTQTNSSILITISNPKIFSSASTTLQPIYRSCSTLNSTYRIAKIQLETMILPSFNLSESSSQISNLTLPSIELFLSSFLSQPDVAPTPIALSISSYLLQLHNCQVPFCQSCQSPYSCLSCTYPYLLQQSSCITECSSGFYLTPSLSTCTPECPSSFYPLLEDYLCIACPQPCLICSDGGKICQKCESGWLLDEGACVQECRKGFEKGDGVCVACRFPCRECDGLCLSCVVGVFYDGFCLNQCPDGMYLGLNGTQQVCEKCLEPCKQCLSKFQCVSCLGQYYLYQGNSSCLETCPQKTVGISQSNNGTLNKMCKPCSYPCFQCSQIQSNCTKCTAGFLTYFNSSGACVQTCQIGYYQNSQFKICSACILPCVQCFTSTGCLACSPQTHLYNYSCVASCPLQTFPTNATQSECVPCIPPCLTCLSPSHCLSCISPIFILFNSTCSLKCPNSTYLFWNETTLLNTCIPCPFGCLTCLQSTCLACTTSLFLYQSQCISSCPIGYFPHSLFRQCITCLQPCLDCFSASQCKNCQPGWIYKEEDRRCYGDCGDGWYNQMGVCKLCDHRCEKCQGNSQNCLECADRYYYQDNTTLICLQTCLEYFYPDPILRLCVPCQPPCLTCTSPTSCLSCIPTMPYLLLKKCTDQCPLGMYKNPSPPTPTCSLCSPKCYTCSYSPLNCTSCTGLSKYLQISQNGTITGTCLESCPDGFYNMQNYICYRCENPCATCEDQRDFCTSCILGYLLYNGTCVESCPVKFFGLGNRCEVCDYQCLSCQYSASNCTSCFQTNYYLFQGNQSFQCVSSCPVGLFNDPITKTCKPCQPLCLECMAEGVCTKCSSQFLLVQYQCRTSCPDAFYPENGLCHLCQSPCLRCLNKNQCKSCVKPFYFVSQTLMQAKNISIEQCVQECPSGTYPFSPSSDSRQCLQCSQKCLQCYDYSACKSCNKSSLLPFLQQTECLASCSLGFFSQTQSLCSPCSQSCLSCISSSNCTQCINSFLFKGSCFPSCPDLYYGDFGGVCHACEQSCQKCYDKMNCVTCREGYYLYETYCLQHCPKEMWAVKEDRVCKKQCELRFRDTNRKICMTECPVYYRYDGQCVDECQNLGIQQVLNSSLGCQRCNGVCPDAPYYKSQLVNLGSQYVLVLIFSHPVSPYDSFSPNYITSSFIEQKILPGELPESNSSTIFSTYTKASKVVASLYPSFSSSTSSSHSRNLLSSPIQVTFSSSSFLLLSMYPQPPSPNSLFLSTLFPLSLFFNGFPIQQPVFLSQMPPTVISSLSFSIIPYLTYILIGLYWLCMAINTVIDNCRVMYNMVDILQEMFVIGMMAWYWAGLAELFRSIGGASGFIEWGDWQGDKTADLWNCRVKRILEFNRCWYAGNIGTVLGFMGGFIVLGSIGKFLLSRYKVESHKVWWNHANNLYWIFGFPLFYAAYDAPLYIFIPISVVLGIITLMSWYISIMDIFTITYNHPIFFFALKKSQSQNPLSNSPYPISLVRRVVLILFSLFSPSQPILSLSLTSLSTLLLLVNGIWNKPYKTTNNNFYGKILPCIQGGYFLFLFLLQIAIVNVKSSNGIWEGASWGCLVLAFGIIGLLFWVVIRETIKGVKKNVRKYRRWRDGKEEGKEVTDSTTQKDTQKKQQQTEQQKQHPSNDKQLQIPNPTQINLHSEHQTCKFTPAKPIHSQSKPPTNLSQQQQQQQQQQQYQQKTQQKNKDEQKSQNYFDESSAGWSSSMSLKPKLHQPAKYLIKIQKKKQRMFGKQQEDKQIQRGVEGDYREKQE